MRSNSEFGSHFQRHRTGVVVMYKHGREFIITIKYNSNDNDPREWTDLQSQLEDLFWLTHGESVELVNITQTGETK